MNLGTPVRSTHSRSGKQIGGSGHLPAFWVVWLMVSVVMGMWEFFATAFQGPLRFWVSSGSCSGEASQLWNQDFWSLVLSITSSFLDSGKPGTVAPWWVSFEQPYQYMLVYKLIHILLLWAGIHSWRPSPQPYTSSPPNNFISTKFPPLNTFLFKIPRPPS